MTDTDLYTRRPDQIVMYSVNWCPDCKRAKFFFVRRRIPYIEVNVDTDPAAEAFIKELNHGNRCVPTIVFPDGSLLVEPSTDQLLEKFSAS